MYFLLLGLYELVLQVEIEHDTRFLTEEEKSWLLDSTVLSSQFELYTPGNLLLSSFPSIPSISNVSILSSLFDCSTLAEDEPDSDKKGSTLPSWAIAVIVLLVLACCAGCFGFLVFRYRQAKEPPKFSENGIEMKKYKDVVSQSNSHLFKQPSVILEKQESISPPPEFLNIRQSPWNFNSRDDEDSEEDDDQSISQTIILTITIQPILFLSLLFSSFFLFDLLNLSISTVNISLPPYLLLSNIH